MNNIVLDIEEKLNILGKINELGLGFNLIYKVEPEKLKKIDLLKNQKYDYAIRDNLLKSDTIFNVYNSDNAQLKYAYSYIFKNTNSNQNLFALMEKYDDEKVILLYELANTLEEENNGNYYYHQRQANELIISIIQHDIKESLSNCELCNLFKSLYKFNKSHSLNKYNNMNELEKLKFENLLKEDFSRLYNNYYDLYEKTENEPDIILLLRFLGEFNIKLENFNVEKPKETVEILNQIKQRYTRENFQLLLHSVFQESVIIKELKMLNYKTNENAVVIDGFINYYKFLYKDNYPEFFDKHEFEFALPDKADLYIYCIRNRKKAFLKLIIEECDIYENIYNSNILFGEKFRKHINLNTLNKDNLKDLMSYSNYHSVIDELEDEQLTFDEFKELNGCSKFIIKLYLKMEMRIDDKLKAITEIKNIEYEKLNMPDISKEEIIERLKRLLEQKPLSRWISEDFSNIKKMKKQKYVQLLLNKDVFSRFIPDIKEESDIDFLILIRNTSFLNLRDLNEAKYMYYKDSKDLKILLEKMDLTDEFKDKNKKSIYEFAAKGLIPIVATLYRDLSSKQGNNILLLTKAYMANQFDKIKFYSNDLDIEIGLKTTNEVKLEWKNNIKKQLKKGYYCEETYDFKTTLEMGVYPKDTCMSWKDGTYKKCLLSNFDTNKKLLIAGDDDGLVARAVIRLTKGTEDENNDSNIKSKLSFKDIEEIDDTRNKNENENEKTQLVLFLERPYIKGVSKNTETKILKTFVEIALEKAKNMNAIVILANEKYDDIIRYENIIYKSIEKKKYNVFISYSKNGLQYLDSFSGQNSVENEGKYFKDNFTIITP